MFLFRNRVFFTGGTGGQQVSTMYFDHEGVGTAQHASDAHGDFFSSMKTKISSSYTITVDTEVLTVNSTTGEITAATTVSPRTFAGEDAGDPLPWQTQGLVKWPTGVFVAGRRLTGRVFIPGPTESSNTNGVPNAGYLTAIQDAGESLLGALDASLFVYSPTHHAAHIAIGASAMPRWASLRSRRD